MSKNILELFTNIFPNKHQIKNGVDQIWIPNSSLSSAEYDWVDYSPAFNELMARSTMTDIIHLQYQGSNSIFFEKVIQKSHAEKQGNDGEFYKADMVLEIPNSDGDLKIKYIMENASIYDVKPKKVSTENLFYDKLAQAVTYAISDNSFNRLMDKIFLGAFLTAYEIYYLDDLRQHMYINSPKSLSWYDALLDTGILSGVYLVKKEILADIKSLYGYKKDNNGEKVRKKIYGSEIKEYSIENNDIFDINTNETFLTYNRTSGGFIKNNLDYIDLKQSDIELDYVSMPEKMDTDNTYKASNRAQKKGGGESDNIRPEYLKNIEADIPKFVKSIIEILEIDDGWTNYATSSKNRVAIALAKAAGMEKVIHAWAPVTTVDIEFHKMNDGVADGETIHTLSTDTALSNGQTSLGTLLNMKDAANDKNTEMKDFLHDRCNIRKKFTVSQMNILKKIFLNHTPIFRIALFEDKDIMGIANRNSQDVRSLSQFDQSTLATKHMMVYMSYALNKSKLLPSGYYMVNNISNLESRKFLPTPNKKINKQIGDMATTSRPYIKLYNMNKIIESTQFSTDVTDITTKIIDPLNTDITRNDINVETLVLGMNFFRTAKEKRKHYVGQEKFYFEFTEDVVPSRIKKGFIATLKNMILRADSMRKQKTDWNKFYNDLNVEEKGNSLIQEVNTLLVAMHNTCKRPILAEDLESLLDKTIKNSDVNVDVSRLAKFLDIDLAVGKHLGVGDDRDSKPKIMPIGAPTAWIGVLDYLQGGDLVNSKNKSVLVEKAVNDLAIRLKKSSISLDNFGNEIGLNKLNDSAIKKIEIFFNGVIDFTKPIDAQKSVSAQANKVDVIVKSQSKNKY